MVNIGHGMEDFIYSLDWIDPSEGPNGFAFCTSLDIRFARKAFARELSDKVRENFQKHGRRIIKAAGLEKMGRIENPYAFHENTFFLRHCVVPGNACDLGIEPTELDDYKRPET